MKPKNIFLKKIFQNKTEHTQLTEQWRAYPARILVRNDERRRNKEED
jgi:hypothetical protein